MKILHFTHKPPNPIKDGGSFAINQLNNSLIELGHQVDLLIVSTDKHEYEKNNNYPFQEFVVHLNTNINYFKAAFAYFTSTSYQLRRFYNKKVESIFKSCLEASNYDLVIFDGLLTGQYLSCSQQLGVKSLYRAHNIEYKLLGTRAYFETNAIKKLYLRRLSKQTKKFEIELIKKADRCAFISNSDINFGLEFNSESSEVSVYSQGRFRQEFIDDFPLKIGFLGAFNYPPNLQAAILLTKVVQSTELINKVKLYLAGNHAEYLKIASKNNIKIVGEIESVNEFMQSIDIFAAPLSYGGGIKIKLVEALANATPIIANTIALEGIVHSEQLLIANNETEFINQLVKICNNLPELKSLSKGAFAIFEKQFSKNQVYNQTKLVLKYFE